VELPAGLEEGEVLWDVELVGGVGAVEDKVEFELPLVGPAVLVGEDDVLCAELLAILGLVRGVTGGVDFRAEGFGPLNAEVAQAADSNDANRLSRSDVGANEGRVGGDTCAEQRCYRVCGIGSMSWGCRRRSR